MDSGDSSMSKVFHFSSGNPRIEETRGVMHLFCNEQPSFSSQLPVSIRRNPSISVLLIVAFVTMLEEDFWACLIDFVET